MPEFTATICKIGMNPVLDLPDEVLRSIFASAGRGKGPLTRNVAKVVEGLVEKL